jgi:LmbE family N-acetylglucosaminyl deacetylase
VADLATRKRLIRYIREFSPDLIIAHRPNDYHADHRASGQLVMDASYLLTVPNECPDAPAMRFMPVIMYNEDKFKNPDFCPTVVLDMDDEIDTKLTIADLNVSQVYEWLPYTYGEEVPEGEEARFAWLKGMEITEDTTDAEVMAAPRGYAVRYAKVAARFRKELIEKYGEERGSKVRYAEAYEICEYGEPMSREMMEELFSF